MKELIEELLLQGRKIAALECENQSLKEKLEKLEKQYLTFGYFQV
jgi:hypothetical protein